MAIDLKKTPNVCAYPDENNENMKIEIELPGVKKEHIIIRMVENGFLLSAKGRDGIEFLSTYSLCCPVKPDKAEAIYENGLLTITVPYKDLFEDAVKLDVK